MKVVNVRYRSQSNYSDVTVAQLIEWSVSGRFDDCSEFFGDPYVGGWYVVAMRTDSEPFETNVPYIQYEAASRADAEDTVMESMLWDWQLGMDGQWHREIWHVVGIGDYDALKRVLDARALPLPY